MCNVFLNTCIITAQHASHSKDIREVRIYRASLSFSISIRALAPVCPWMIFPDEGGIVSIRDAMHHKYSNKIPKHYVILFTIKRVTRWRRLRFDTDNSF